MADRQDYTRQALDLLPPGKVWTRELSSVLASVFRALSGELERIDQRGRDVIEESDPRTVLELLVEWETAYGLPGACMQLAGTVQLRKLALVAKVTSLGGQTPAYFEQVAQTLGFEVEIEEAGQFRVGANRTGDTLYGDGWQWTWIVHAPPFAITLAEAGVSTAGQPLQASTPDLLECTLAELKPAHTQMLVVKDLPPPDGYAPFNQLAPPTPPFEMQAIQPANINIAGQSGGGGKASGMNVSEFSDYTPMAGAVINILNMGRKWLTLPAGQGFLQSDGFGTANVNAQGIPTSLDAGQVLDTVLMLAQLPGGQGTTEIAPVYRSGTYHIIANAAGLDFAVGFDASGLFQDSSTNWRFTVNTPTAAGIALRVTAATGNVTRLAVVHEDDLADYNAGKYFRPNFAADVSIFKVLRWMESDKINVEANPTILPADYLFWTIAGAPIEVQAAFCREQNIEPWACCPEPFDQTERRAWIQRWKDAMDGSPLMLWLEHSNEKWNGNYYVPKQETSPGSGTFVPIYDPATNGNAHVWISGSQLIPGQLTWQEACDLIPHPTVTDHLGQAAFAIGPSPYFPADPAVEADGYSASQRYMGAKAQLFFDDVAFVYGAELATRVKLVLGVQAVNDFLTTIIAAEAPSAQYCAFAPYVPNIPTSFATAAEAYTNMDAALPIANSWTTNQVARCATLGLIPCMYEAVGPQILAESGQASFDAMVEVNTSAAIKPYVRALYDHAETEYPGMMIVHYGGHEYPSTSGGMYGQQVYPGQPLSECPKRQAIVEWQQA